MHKHNLHVYIIIYSSPVCHVFFFFSLFCTTLGYLSHDYIHATLVICNSFYYLTSYGCKSFYEPIIHIIRHNIILRQRICSHARDNKLGTSFFFLFPLSFFYLMTSVILRLERDWSPKHTSILLSQTKMPWILDSLMPDANENL